MLCYYIKLYFIIISVMILRILNVDCTFRNTVKPVNELITNNDILVQSPTTIKMKWPMTKMKTFMDLVAPGYTAEEHTVVTVDGYILLVHRISGSFLSPKGGEKSAVLFLHGMMAASDIWILRGPDHDLPYLLADSGYDVWALNVRGNFYSKRHQHLSTRDPKFWQFSWHEVGVYDVPATIDYILKLTGQSKLSLIGHSMGGTAELVLLSELSEYNSKLNVVIAWAPVSLVTHNVPGLVTSIFFNYGNEIQKILDSLNVHEIFPRNLSVSSKFAGIWLKLCDKIRIRDICTNFYKYIFGINDLEELDFSLLSQALQHYPQGTSVQTLSHYRQIIITRKFRRYDFGPIGNAMRYGSLINMDYSLHKISAPVVVYYGSDDPFVTSKDIQALLNKVPHAIARHIPNEKFGHLDFLLLNQTKHLYEDVMQVLNYYNNK